MRIAFIGAGKMAEALIAALRGDQIMASDVRTERLQHLKKKYKIRVTHDNLQAFDFGEVVVLAVKPQNISGVITELGTCLPAGKAQITENRKLIISIAAGIPLAYLQKRLVGYSIIRAMPNNPCLVKAGITALAKGKKVSFSQMQKAKAVFQSVGEALEVPEKWMDAITGLSGSGPAFVYQVIHALAAGGVASGLPKAVAKKLAYQTIIGAGETVKRTGIHPQELCDMVTSPGGTTMEGLKVLHKYKVVKAISSAVVAAAKKSKKLCQS